MKSIIIAINKKINYVYKLCRWFILSFSPINRVNKIEISDERILIVGNGPSAAQFDYEQAKEHGYEIACVNFFALDEERFRNVKPKYYCLLDNCFYESDKDEESQISRLFRILASVTWQMNMVCFKSKIKSPNDNRIRNIYINGNELNEVWENLQYKLYDKNKATFGYQNVILGLLFCFISAGVKSIALIGVENDWHRELFVDQNNDVWRDVVHFNSIERINLTKKGEIRKHELYKYFYYYYVTIYHYFLAAQYARYKGVHITNLTLNSYIDVFDKKSALDFYSSQAGEIK